MLSQNDASDKLEVIGECKRRTMTRYEKENRNSKDKRLDEIADILSVNVNSINNIIMLIIRFIYKKRFN